MAIRKIVLMGNPVLKEVAAPVENVRAEAVARLAEDMKDTLVDIDARGIAAPQVSVGQRLVVYRLPAEHIPKGSATAPVPWTAMINPVIEPLSDDCQMIWERCLSLPGLFGRVETAPGHSDHLFDAGWNEGRARRPRVPRHAPATRVRPPGRRPLPDAHRGT